MKIRYLITGILGIMSFTLNAQFERYSEPMKLPGTVNQDMEESLPVFSKDSSILYFTRTFDPLSIGGIDDQDIFFAKRESDGSYSNVSSLSDMNNKFNNAVLGINNAGNRMYLLDAYDGKKDQKKDRAPS